MGKGFLFLGLRDTSSIPGIGVLLGVTQTVWWALKGVVRGQWVKKEEENVLFTWRGRLQQIRTSSGSRRNTPPSP